MPWPWDWKSRCAFTFLPRSVFGRGVELPGREASEMTHRSARILLEKKGSAHQKIPEALRTRGAHFIFYIYLFIWSPRALCCRRTFFKSLVKSRRSFNSRGLFAPRPRNSICRSPAHAVSAGYIMHSTGHLIGNGATRKAGSEYLLILEKYGGRRTEVGIERTTCNVTISLGHRPCFI